MRLSSSITSSSLALLLTGVVSTLPQAQAFVPLHSTGHNHKNNNNQIQQRTGPSSPSPSSASTELSAGIDISSVTNSIQSLPATVDSLVLDFSNKLSALDPTTIELIQSALTPWHLAAIGAFGVGSSLLYFITTPEIFDEAPYAPGTTTYSPQAADEFYKKRPLMVAKRLLKLAVLTSSFNSGILFDWLVLGKLFRDEEYTALRKNEPRRAKVALKLCEQLGPTFIKLGQALSIRTDLVPEAYALELRQLQDAVPPFDSIEAREVLKRELGVNDLSQVFADLSPEPVASASIGQVYRGTLAENGKDVAVKVQRPGILAEIALGM